MPSAAPFPTPSAASFPTPGAAPAPVPGISAPRAHGPITLCLG
jgi:hypothetical protein